MKTEQQIKNSSGWKNVRRKLPIIGKAGACAVIAGALSVGDAIAAAMGTNSPVFVIVMENHIWSDIKGSPSAPYINNVLLPMGAHAEQYYNPAAIHPSLPNYLWMEAGTNFGIFDDNMPAINHQSTTNHLVTQLKNAGLSWRAYAENIDGTSCPLVDNYPFSPRHLPFVYFDDVTGTNTTNSPGCIANIRPFTQLAGDLSSNKVAKYNFIVPNVCSDMHDSSGCATTNAILNGDTWLSNNLPAILNSPSYTNGGAVFIVWDEGEGGSDGPIGLIALSPYAKAGYSNSNYYDHSSLLRTVQKIYGVRPFLGAAADALDLSDLFVPNAIPNRDAFVMNGSLDATNILRSAASMHIWASVHDQTLYVATWSPGNYPGDTNKNDHFIFVSDQILPAATQPAVWTKNGSIAVTNTKPFIGGESGNNFAGWFNAPAGSSVAKSSDNSGVLEGTIDLVAAFGPAIMTGTIYVAAAAYNTADGGALAAQGPAAQGTPDGNIDPGEFLALSVQSLVDYSRTHGAMAVAGTFNGWDPSLTNMQLVADNAWQFDAVFTNASGVEFKFAADGSWSADNWGENNQTVFLAPFSGTGELSGGNIVVSNTLNGTYRFAFNEQTRAYSLLSLTPDSVGDGIADWWRAQYFGGNGTTTNGQSCAACDPDGDGFNNLQEFWLGTVPTNLQSRLEMLGVSNLTSTARQLQWRSVGGKRYFIDFSDSFPAGFSNLTTVVETNAGSGVGTSSVFTDSTATNAQRVYRIRVVP